MSRSLALVLALATLSLAPAPAGAQPAEAAVEQARLRAMSMGEVLAAAARGNPNLLQASVNIERANAQAFTATGIDDWVVSATASLFVQRNEAVEGNVTGTNSVDIYSISAAIVRALPTGGTIGVSFQGRRRETVFALAEDRVNRDYTGELSLDFTQPLLRGRGQHVARAQLRQTRLASSAEVLSREAAVRETMRQVISAYWDVVLAWQELQIREASLALAAERRRVTNAAIDAGTVAPTEALAVEQIITTREEAILAAKLAITERSLDLRRLAFLELGPDDIDIRSTELGDVPTRSFDRAALIERALESSPEIAALKVLGEGATLEVEVTENNMLPRLDLALTFGPQGTERTFLDAAERLGRLQGYQVSATLSYEQALQNRAARGQAEAARAERRRVRIDLRDARQQVALSMVRAIQLADTARRRIELAERTIALAERNVEAEKARFALGRSTNFDVLLRQDELRDAQLRYARAKVDFLKAQAIIDALTGDLGPKYGVSVSG